MFLGLPFGSKSKEVLLRGTTQSFETRLDLFNCSGRQYSWVERALGIEVWVASSSSRVTLAFTLTRFMKSSQSLNLSGINFLIYKMRLVLPSFFNSKILFKGFLKMLRVSM